MAESEALRITRRPGQAVLINGTRVLVESIPDNRVVLAIYPEPGTNVVREERR